MGRSDFKTWKMGLPEDSLAWQDLLEYGRELGMQPAEVARVIIVEWSQARRGRLSIGGGMMPAFTAPPIPPAAVPALPTKESEQNKAKARGIRVAKNFIDDDD